MQSGKKIIKTILPLIFCLLALAVLVQPVSAADGPVVLNISPSTVPANNQITIDLEVAPPATAPWLSSDVLTVELFSWNESLQDYIPYIGGEINTSIYTSSIQLDMSSISEGSYLVKVIRNSEIIAQGDFSTGIPWLDNSFTPVVPPSIGLLSLDGDVLDGLDTSEMVIDLYDIDWFNYLSWPVMQFKGYKDGATYGIPEGGAVASDATGPATFLNCYAYQQLQGRFSYNSDAGIYAGTGVEITDFESLYDTSSGATYVFDFDPMDLADSVCIRDNTLPDYGWEYRRYDPTGNWRLLDVTKPYAPVTVATGTMEPLKMKIFWDPDNFGINSTIMGGSTLIVDSGSDLYNELQNRFRTDRLQLDYNSVTPPNSAENPTADPALQWAIFDFDITLKPDQPTPVASSIMVNVQSNAVGDKLDVQFPTSLLLDPGTYYLGTDGDFDIQNLNGKAVMVEPLSVLPEIRVSNYVGMPGAQLLVPIEGKYLSSVYGTQFTLTFDPSIVQIQQAQDEFGQPKFDDQQQPVWDIVATDPNLTIQANVDNTLGEAYIGIATTNGMADGTLCNVKFSLIGPYGTQTPLMIDPLDGVVMTDQQGQIINAYNLFDGSISISGMYGDVNNNGIVEVGDPVLVLRHYAQTITLSDAQLQAANVDGSSAVDSSDAILILQKIVRLLSTFPAEQGPVN